ncbi:MAG: DUF1080 domain-containing protein [Planctomycetes bacterium]|nr:DUF1080 domain-containing protein [Planctomycetota bacterium]
MRLLPCVAFLFTAGFVVAADDFKVESGYKLIFNGKNLDGWQTKAAGKDGKAEALQGKTEAFDGRFKVADGELVIDPKVKGDKYIETVMPVSGDFTIRFDFKPAEGCNNDMLFLGMKFDIKAGGKDNVKGVKVGEWNKMEIVVKGGSADFIINGEKAGTQKAKGDKGAFTLRAEFGGISYKNLRITEGK